MKNITSSQIKEVVLYFLGQIGKKANKADIVRNIPIAKELLQTYTVDEVKLAIDYNIQNPPPKGFYSMAWLNYCIADIVNKHKADQVKEEIEKINIIAEEVNHVTSRYNGNRVPTWIRKGYSLDLFKPTREDN